MALKTYRSDDQTIASIQNPEKRVKKEMELSFVLSSIGSNEVGEYGKQVIVRGSTSQTINIRLDIERELARYENLVANRGSKTYTSSSSED